MKKIIIILTAIMFSSCVKELEKYERQYSVKNKSTQNIRLKFYLTTNFQLVYGAEIFLNNTELFYGENIEFTSPHSDDNNNSEPRSSFKGSDSLVVIYNNQRKTSYMIDFNGNFSIPIDRNPFRHGNYNNIGNDNFQFIFTEDDYNNAVDCGGNCD